ncbi:YSC84-related protein [Litoribrevibacter albus]|uniref:Ysc84 actin-binding domain-containing protein n=1 Tax=Litoribrevibacter albus TaxID=1473156 RepID=A0AA37SAS2_9GAMM|nr:YSC84-related protein [Litoribrevibacter albus]GLQ31801.1 hypothetical protein GCM10007876_22800 [Litoribrevibacter albus]
MKRSTHILSVLFLSLSFSSFSFAASKTEIDAKSYAAVQILKQDVPGASELIEKAYAMLVFPEVYGGGFGIGGEYGEGKMFVEDYTYGYYNLVSANVGFLMGAQVKSEAILFMTKEAFDRFVQIDGWEAGVDGSVALAELGVAESLDTNAIQEPIIAFIYSNKGLIFNLTLEGTKISKIQK